MAPSDPSFIEAGFTCAKLIADPKSWINRRVETVEMLTQEETRRRVSVDFTLSAQQRAALTTRHGEVVPISVLSKQPLRNFDLRDEQPASLPILNRADNGALGLTALLSAALDAIPAAAADERAVELLTAELQEIVCGDERPAREVLSAFVGAAEEGDPIRAPVWEDETCRTLLRTLASDYVLFAALPAGGPDRRVLKYSYGEDFPLDPPWKRRLDRYAPAEVWWRLRKPDRTWFLIDCPAAWRAASFHMEIAIPEELRVGYAELGRFSSDGGEAPEPLGAPDELANRSALYAGQEIAPHDDVRAYVEVVSERDGGAVRAAMTALAVTALLWLGWLSGLDAEAPGAAVSLLVAGGAVVSGLAASTGHHIIVNKLLRGRRRTLTLVTVAAIAASASLAMELPSRRPLEVWLVAAIICSTAALRLGWSAVRAAK